MLFFLTAVPSFFEGAGAEKTKSEEKAVEEPCVVVSPDLTLRVCSGCHEAFRQFYDQESEEWKYKNAIEVDGVNFHPSCHQDMLMVSKIQSFDNCNSSNVNIVSMCCILHCG